MSNPNDLGLNNRNRRLFVSMPFLPIPFFNSNHGKQSDQLILQCNGLFACNPTDGVTFALIIIIFIKSVSFSVNYKLEYWNPFLHHDNVKYSATL